MLLSLRHPAMRYVALLSVFCCALEVLRIIGTETISYIFLPANLILAWIPVGFAYLFYRATKTWKLLLFFSCWLVFFPNSPYLITDLVHLKPRNACPFWYDILMLYSFAFAGLVAGMFSAVAVYAKLKQYTAQWKAKIAMACIMLAAGYGIYIGRFLRWNSWDILVSPLGILSDTLHRITSPGEYPRTYAVTIIVGIMLTLVFMVFESLTRQPKLEG